MIPFVVKERFFDKMPEPPNKKTSRLLDVEQLLSTYNMEVNPIEHLKFSDTDNFSYYEVDSNPFS